MHLDQMHPDLEQAARDAGRNECSQRMRIVGGRLKGRALLGPKTQDIRPTSDLSARDDFQYSRACLWRSRRRRCGSSIFRRDRRHGARSAVARRQAGALLVDDGTTARALIRANVDTLGLGGATKIFRRDARNFGAAPAGDRFTLAFLDPPYGKGLAEPALIALRDGSWLVPDALLVVEEAAGAVIEIPAGFTRNSRPAAMAIRKCSSCGATRQHQIRCPE